MSSRGDNMEEFARTPSKFPNLFAQIGQAVGVQNQDENPEF